MDLSSSLPWLLEMEDPELMDQIDMEFLYEFTTQNLAPALGEDIQQSSSSMNTSSSASLFSNSHSSTNVASTEISQPRPGKSMEQQMPKNYTSDNPQSVSEPAETSSILKVLSLNTSKFSTNPQDPNEDLMGTMNQMDDALLLKNISSLSDVFMSQGSSCLNQDLAIEAGKSKKKKSSTIRDHIDAERKRREKLSEGFITLSSIVPGLKKMDKVSVLEEAIKYMKQLQERVTAFEEQIAEKASESMVIVNRSHLLAKDDDDSSTIENFISSSEKQLLEIEARVSDTNVLIKIHCEKQNVLVKILAELEKLKLTVVNTSVVPFGNFAFDITIIAQSENDMCMAGKHLVRSLRSALNFL